jgi:hypothetical protein
MKPIGMLSKRIQLWKEGLLRMMTDWSTSYLL